MNRIWCKGWLDSLGFCAKVAFIPPFFVQAVGGGVGRDRRYMRER